MKKVALALTLSGAAAAAASPAHAEVIIGPRASYYFDNSNLRVSDLNNDINPEPVLDEERTRLLREDFGDDASLFSEDEGAGRLADQIGFPMFGGSASFGDDRDRFTVTAMYGSGSGEVATIFNSSRTLSAGDIEIVDLSIVRLDGDFETDRYDLELTWQRRLNEKFAIFGGFRYERLETTGASDINVQGTQQIETIFAELEGRDPPSANIDSLVTVDDPVALTYRTTLETFSFRAGVTAFVPVNSSMTAFFNGMLHASYQPDYGTDTTFINFVGDPLFDTNVKSNGEFSAGPDIAVGAQFSITENISMDVRYRAVLFFPLSGDFSFNDARVNHGVNLGLSLRL